VGFDSDCLDSPGYSRVSDFGSLGQLPTYDMIGPHFPA